MTVGCLTEVELFQAFRGELSPEEAQEAMRHILNCPLCHDQWKHFLLDDQVATGFRAAMLGDVDGADEAPGLRELKDLPADLQLPGFRMSGSFVEGGQARVYRAIHEASEEVVAIKVFHNSALNEGGNSRFSRELRSLARLRHPNVIPIRSEGEVQGHAYFVMPWIEGLPLDEYVQKYQPAERERLTLMAKICDAVSHAHKRGVMHLDLKPTNVRVDAAGEPVVLDFGLARLVTGDAIANMPVAGFGIAGTPPYMAPEQVAGLSEVDTRADVYSLGLLLFEVLAGRRAKGDGLEDADLAEMEVALQPVPSIRAVTRVGRDLAAVVDHAVAVDRELRYQTAERMQEDLQRYLNGEPVAAMHSRPIYVLGKLVRRHLAAFVIVMSTVLLTTGGAIYMQMKFEEVAARYDAHVAELVQDLGAERSSLRVGKLYDQTVEMQRLYEELAEKSLLLGDKASAEEYQQKADSLLNARYVAPVLPLDESEEPPPMR